MQTPKQLSPDALQSNGQVLIFLGRAALPVLWHEKTYDIQNKAVKIIGGKPPLVALRYIGMIDEVMVTPDRIRAQWVRIDDWLNGKYDPPLGSDQNPHAPLGSRP